MAGYPRSYRFDWLEAVMRAPDLTSGAKVAAWGLATFWNARKGYAYPSYSKLAQACGMKVHGVRPAVDKLRAAGFVEAHKRGFQTSLAFFLVLPESRGPDSANVRSQPHIGGGEGEGPMCGPGSTQCAATASPNPVAEPCTKNATGEEYGSRGETTDQARAWVVRIVLVMLELDEENTIDDTSVEDWIAIALGSTLEELAERHRQGVIRKEDVAAALERAGLDKTLAVIRARGKVA